MLPYTLDDIPTDEPGPVAEACGVILRRLFPGADLAYLPELFDGVARLFRDGFGRYLPMDTRYHDLEHTLQCALCLARMLEGRHEAGIAPVLDPRGARVAIAAMLLHDVGYVKDRSEPAGTGAKYTFFHERRSCEIADQFLRLRNWAEGDIEAVKDLISCTGPRSRIELVPFHDPLEGVLGRAVCTADYVGQMSDPKYPWKLPGLFAEFQESDDYRGIPMEKRVFKTLAGLLKGTPFFWEKMVVPRLEGECLGLFHFLAVPGPGGHNPYVERIVANVRYVQDHAESLAATPA